MLAVAPNGGRKTEADHPALPLSADELARYSGQYRHAVEAIAELSESAAEALPQRPELRSHAAEEREHVTLWDGFVAAAGGHADDAPTVETSA